MASFGKYTYGDDKLIAIIGEEDIVVGFLLGGIGEVKDLGQGKAERNFKIVTRETTEDEIEQALKSFISRKDIGLILITYKPSQMVAGFLYNYGHYMLPSIMVIPGKYDDPKKMEDELTVIVNDAMDRYLRDTT